MTCALLDERDAQAAVADGLNRRPDPVLALVAYLMAKG